MTAGYEAFFSRKQLDRLETLVSSQEKIPQIEEMSFEELESELLARRKADLKRIYARGEENYLGKLERDTTGFFVEIWT